MVEVVGNQPVSPESWVVLGSTGFVGQGVVAEIIRRGIQVRRISAPRLAASPSLGSADLATLAEDSEYLESLVSQFRGAKVVINAAGMATPDDAGSDALFGANAALPVLIVKAAVLAGVKRVVLLSSAAVQGNREVLDETIDTAPFSPYSKSKALGEAGVLSLASQHPDTCVLIIRATSVQGIGRPTTESLRRIARTRLASVASPGTQPSVVSSIEGLSEFVVEVASYADFASSTILVQPWEGANVSDVLKLAGGKPPLILPAWLCRTLISLGQLTGRIVPRLGGMVRRVEVMWFGQKQTEGSAVQAGLVAGRRPEQGPSEHLTQALRGSGG